MTKSKTDSTTPTNDAQAQLDTLRAMIRDYAKNPAHLAVYGVLFLEGGSTTYSILKNQYKIPQLFLDITLKGMHVMGLLRYDGNNVTKL